MTVCMACGICAEVCPFDSIKMDRVFELARTKREMVLNKRKHYIPSWVYRRL